MKNKLSIVIPCYNAEKYIRKCLDSLFAAIAKVDKNWCEVIVVNDGSTDGTLDILQRYEANIKILMTENQGVSAARNHGLANINGGGTSGLLMLMMRWTSIASNSYSDHWNRTLLMQ